MDKATESLKKLGRAIEQLHKVVALPLDTDKIVRDSTIQRFEMVIELYWKTLKHLLEKEGIIVAFPKQALQRAYQAEWINDEKVWLSMLTDRNETSHIYDEERAQEIYENIKGYYPVLEHTYKKLITL